MARQTTCPSSGYWNTTPLLGRVDRARVNWIYCPCAMDMKTVCVTAYAQTTTSLQCVSLFTDALYSVFTIVFLLYHPCFRTASQTYHLVYDLLCVISALILGLLTIRCYPNKKHLIYILPWNHFLHEVVMYPKATSQATSINLLTDHFTHS